MNIMNFDEEILAFLTSAILIAIVLISILIFNLKSRIKAKNEIIERNWFLEEIEGQKKIHAYLEYILSYKDLYLRRYVNKRQSARRSSWIHLLCALIFFGLSLIFPLLTGIGFSILDSNDASTFYALGYISLIISTLILLADRLFIHSRGWIRYSVTINQIETVCSNYYSKWLINLPTISSNATRTIMILHDFDKSLKEIIKSETDNWRDVFTGQLEDFNKQANSRLNHKDSDIGEFLESTKHKPVEFRTVKLEINAKNLKEEFSINFGLMNGDDRLILKGKLTFIEPKHLETNIPIGTYRLFLDIYRRKDLLQKDSRFVPLKGDKEIYTEIIDMK